LLPFDTDEPEFVRGFEAGHVWTKLRGSDERQFSVHADNAEMMLRIAEALDLCVSSEDLDGSDGTWLEVTFEEAG
jgi:hypothetical protein